MHWQAGDALKPLHDLVAGMLRDLTPVMGLGGLCKAIQVLYGWNRPLHKEAITRLLPAFPDLKFVNGRYVCLCSFRCVDCPTLPRLLDSVLTDTQQTRIDLAPLARRLRAQLLKADDCRQCGNCQQGRRSTCFVSRMPRSELASKRFRLVKNELRNVEHERALKTSIPKLLESILKDHAGPMSYQKRTLS